MNNPFTVEETNLMCVFETSNRMKLMEEIRRVMLHIKDSDMEELAGQVLRKLDGMTDKEFLKISFGKGGLHLDFCFYHKRSPLIQTEHAGQ